MVRAVRMMDIRDDLSPTEAFVFSRLTAQACSVQYTRSMVCAVHELDTILCRLEQKGLVTIEHNEHGALFERELSNLSRAADMVLGFAKPRSDKSTGGHYQYEAHEVARVLELVEYFKRTHHYEGALRVLRRALDVSPTEGEFHRQLALVHARASGDMKRAFRAIDCALQLEPQNESFRKTHDYLRNLAKQTDGMDERGARTPNAR